MKTLVQWLAGCGCFDITPVTVEISGEKWEAARYSQKFVYGADMDAVRSGTHKAGEIYTEEAIYCIGKLPKCKLRRGKPIHDAKICFPFEGVDWFCAGYCMEFKPEQAEFHPFGANWMLRPWKVPDGTKIDHYERKPYTRIPLIVKPV